MRHRLPMTLAAAVICLAGPSFAASPAASPAAGGDLRLAQTDQSTTAPSTQSTTDRARKLEQERNRARSETTPQDKTQETTRARQLEQERNRARTLEAGKSKTATTDRARQLEQTRDRARTEEGKTTPKTPQTQQ